MSSVSLRLRMVDAVGRAWKDNQSVYILLDKSSSISGFESELGRLALSIAAQVANESDVQEADKNEFCVIEFAKDARVLCSPTTKMADIYAKIEAMAPAKGSTNIAAGLELVLDTLAPGHKSKVQLWVVTDGAYNAGAGGNVFVNQLREKNVLITVIGVGNINMTGLKEVATFGRAFQASSFQQAMEFVKDGNVVIPEIKLRAHLCNPSNRMGDPVDFKLQIENRSQVPIKAGGRMVIGMKSTYFEKTTIILNKDINPDTTVETDFTLECLPGIKEGGYRAAGQAFQEQVNIILTDREMKPNPYVCEKGFCLQMHHFAQDIYDFEPRKLVNTRHYIPQPKVVNIASLGQAGTGKSSTLSTFESALSSQPQPDVVAAGRGARCTHEFTKFTLGEKLSDIPVRFFDTPGREGDPAGDGYKGVDLPLLLAGMIPDNTRLVLPELSRGLFRLADIPERQRLSDEEAWARTIHTGILFIHASSVGVESLAYEKELVSQFIVQYNRILTVVVTNVDQVSANEVSTIALTVANDIGIDERYVFCLRNYCSLPRNEIVKNFDIDAMALQILHAVLEGANTFIKRWDDTIDRIIKAGTEKENLLRLLPDPDAPEMPEVLVHVSPPPSTTDVQSVLSLPQRILQATFALKSQCTPFESRLSDRDGNLIEEWIDEREDFQAQYDAVKAKYLTFFAPNGEPIVANDEAGCFAGYSRSVKVLKKYAPSLHGGLPVAQSKERIQSDAVPHVAHGQDTQSQAPSELTFQMVQPSAGSVWSEDNS